MHVISPVVDVSDDCTPLCDTTDVPEPGSGATHYHYLYHTRNKINKTVGKYRKLCLVSEHFTSLNYNMNILNVPFTLVMLSSCVCESSLEELKIRIAEKAKLITDATDFDMTKLPILETKMRNSTSCPGVEERVTLHRY